jgi:tetratricopeptide (TPR) repeat protein
MDIIRNNLLSPQTESYWKLFIKLIDSRSIYEAEKSMHATVEKCSNAAQIYHSTSVELQSCLNSLTCESKHSLDYVLIQMAIIDVKFECMRSSCVTSLMKLDLEIVEECIKIVDRLYCISSVTKLQAYNLYTLLYNMHGIYLHEFRKLKEALYAYTRAIEYDPLYACGYYNRANVYVDLSMLKEAYDDYSLAVKLDPSESLYYRGRGRVMFEQNRNEEAIEQFTIAIGTDSKKASFSYYWRSLCYGRVQNYVSALADAKAAYELDKSVFREDYFRHYRRALMRKSAASIELSCSETATATMATATENV